MSSAAWETLIQIVANTRTVRLSEWSVSFQGITTTDAPVLVQLVRYSTAGTSGASVTPGRRNLVASTADASVNQQFSAEPTVSEILESHYITPTGGLFVYQYPEDAEVLATAGERLGLRVNPPTSSVDCAANFAWDEL